MATTPKPPSHLSKSSQALWSKILAEFRTDSPGALDVLTSALELRDRAEDAAAIVRKEGLTRAGQRGIEQAHPLLTVERASWKESANLLKSLGLFE